MKAVVFRQFGEPAEVLTTEDVPVPQPGPGMVRVRMIASPVNPSDLMTVRGIYGRQPPLPATPGYEGVGVVEAGGGPLGWMLKGRRVAALNGTGGNWAEYAVIPARRAIPLPSALPWAQAAMFFVNPVTAYVMTRRVLAVPRGTWLLQTAAGSALGRMVIRLGQEYGFRTLNVVRRPEQAEELSRLADGHGTAVAFDGDRQSPDELRELVDRHTGGAGVGYAIDPVGGGTASAVVGCLGTGGRLLVYGTLSGEPMSFAPRELMTHSARVEGFWLAPWMERLGLVGRLQLIRRVGKLIQSGVLNSEVGGVFPLDEIQSAVRQSEQPGHGGKVLLQIGEP
jgi:NADPH:quinone reductase-like Zn-dependent oxidoreductase